MDGIVEAALAAMRGRIASPAWADDLSMPPPFGSELDKLAEDIPVAQWSAERHAALAALRAVALVQKLAVLGMARNEAPSGGVDRPLPGNRRRADFCLQQRQ